MKSLLSASIRLAWGFPGVSVVKNLPAMQETWVWSLGQEDHLEEGVATHSSILAWRIPWTEYPGGLQSMHRVRHDWSNLAYTHIRLAQWFWKCSLTLKGLWCPFNGAMRSKQFLKYTNMLVLPWWLSDKESACKCRRHRFDPQSRKIPLALEQGSLCTIIDPMLQSPGTTTSELTVATTEARMH